MMKNIYLIFICSTTEVQHTYCLQLDQKEKIVNMIIGSAGWGPNISKIGSLKFTKTVLKHLNNPARTVSRSLLEKTIMYGKKSIDPQWTWAIMYTIDMVKNKTKYVLEVLYDNVSNMILHFKHFK